jgi:hypothetical protein
MTRFWMRRNPTLANDLGVFLMQCPKNSLISAWPLKAFDATQPAVVWKDPSSRCAQSQSCSQTKGQHRSAGPGEKLIDIRHLLQVSLTIFKSVTRRSPYASFPAAFSIWPSFFRSAFSCACDSRFAEPVTVT